MGLADRDYMKKRAVERQRGVLHGFEALRRRPEAKWVMAVLAILAALLLVYVV